MEKRKFSGETKEKMRLARLGKKWSDEVKRKINESKKGKTYEDIYGIEKAKTMKQQKREQMIGPNNPMCGIEPWNKNKKGLQTHSETTKDLLRTYRYNQKNSPENNPEIGRKVSLALKGRTYDQIYGIEKANELKNMRKKCAIDAIKNGRKNFGFPTDGTMKVKRQIQIMPIKDTKIEIKIQNYLKELGLRFFTHQYRKEIKYGYQCDILIPIQKGIDQKTIIECDGDWWHGNTKIYDFRKLPQYVKEQIPLDFERTSQLEEVGYRVIRLWENEINRMSFMDFKELLNEEINSDNQIVMKGGNKR